MAQRALMSINDNLLLSVPLTHTHTHLTGQNQGHVRDSVIKRLCDLQGYTWIINVKITIKCI